MVLLGKWELRGEKGGAVGTGGIGTSAIAIVAGQHTSLHAVPTLNKLLNTSVCVTVVVLSCPSSIPLRGSL